MENERRFQGGVCVCVCVCETVLQGMDGVLIGGFGWREMELKKD